MISSRPHGTVAVLALGALLIAACGSDDATQTETDAEAPVVVATTSIWADVAANVACDGLARVETIIPPGGDPHSFEPSLRDRETMDAADLVIANGLFLEESLDDSINAVESDGVTVLRVAEGLDPLPIGDDHEDHTDEEHTDEDHTDEEHTDEDHTDEDHTDEDHTDEDHTDEDHTDEDHTDEDHADSTPDDDHDHDHGDMDPHVWWDPTRVATAVPLIADALAGAGIDRAALDACADRYVDELTALDTDIEAIVAPLAIDDRLLVTNHDSLSYFADRYDFQVLGSVIPSSSSLAATSPAELDALADEIEATGVAAIFADTQNSSTDADALANRIGDIDVVDLLTGTLDEPDSEAGTYIDWLRTNAQTIVDALTRTATS